MPDFTDALSKKFEDVEKPKPRPKGFYVGIIQGVPKKKTVTEKDSGNERLILSFNVKIMSVKEGVDEEALAEHGEISTWPPFQKDVWYDTPEGEWQLRQFLAESLEIPGKGKSLGQMAAEAAGKKLVVELENYPYTSRDGVAEIGTRIKSTAKL